MKPIASVRFLLSISLTLQALALIAQQGSVKGVVVDGDLKPLSYATVYALPEEDMTKPILVKADEAGQFVYDKLPSGNVYFDADKKDDGYPYSLFSFYISPGQDKPKVQVRSGQMLDNIVIRMGKRVAYLKLTVTNEKGEEVPPCFHFYRPDIADHRGDLGYCVSAQNPLPVPAVPFSFDVQADGYQTWMYQDPEGAHLVSLKPGGQLKLDIKLIADPKKVQ